MIAWEAAAGPTVHRQGSRFARPAPPACDHGLLCAIAPKLQRKREVATLQRDMAWSSAVLWIGQACHTGAMAPAQESRRRRVPADASLASGDGALTIRYRSRAVATRHPWRTPALHHQASEGRA